MSQFAFLRAEWGPVYDAAARAEFAANRDPRTSSFYAQRALELVVKPPLYAESDSGLFPGATWVGVAKPCGGQAESIA